MYQYIQTIWQILHSGTFKSGRNGNTYSLFAPQLRFDLSAGFPLDTTRLINFYAAKCEFLWMIQGRCDSVDWLNEQGVHIWDKWARPDGSLGPIYGIQWRDWKGGAIFKDQIEALIDGLFQNPASRRHIVTAWNPAELPDMMLPPCHVLFQLVFDGRLNLHLYQRSADWMIGVPYNIAFYALMLEVLAKRIGGTAGQLVISYGDAHIYEEHADAALEQTERYPRALPSLHLPEAINDIDALSPDDIQISGYDPYPAISYTLKE